MNANAAAMSIGSAGVAALARAREDACIALSCREQCMGTCGRGQASSTHYGKQRIMSTHEPHNRRPSLLAVDAAAAATADGDSHNGLAVPVLVGATASTLRRRSSTTTTHRPHVAPSAMRSSACAGSGLWVGIEAADARRHAAPRPSL